MLNIVIPMAGLGSRFSKAGFTDPKPLIPIHGIPMIQLVIANLRPRDEHRFLFVCQREHLAQYELEKRLSQWSIDAEIIVLDGITEGAACTVLAAKKWIDNADALMIANSDQYIDSSIDAYLTEMTKRSLDGFIMTMTADDPKWSFIATDASGYVTRVVEKEVISSNATVGIYNFAHGHDFVESASEMIAANERVNGEFYVAPVYNRMIAKDKRIGFYDIGSEGRGMHGLGTPADLSQFLATSLASRVVKELV